MVKCVRHIAREAAGHEPIALVWTLLKQSGRRFSSGSTNSPTPTPKNCSSVCTEAWPALSRQGNCGLSNAESNSGAVKSPANWCWGLDLKQKSTGAFAPQATPFLPRCAHDQLAGFQIDQAHGDIGVCAPALPSKAPAEWKRPISGMLPDSLWRRP